MTVKIKTVNIIDPNLTFQTIRSGVFLFLHMKVEKKAYIIIIIIIIRSNIQAQQKRNTQCTIINSRFIHAKRYQFPGIGVFRTSNFKLKYLRN